MRSKDKSTKGQKTLNIVIPMAGSGNHFIQAGYTFPKPLIDVNGKPMIQAVIENLSLKSPHKFILICQKEHWDKYSLNEIFKNATGDNFEVVLLSLPTKGALCTVLTAIDQINTDSELIIANGDQLIDKDLNSFLAAARKSKSDGYIVTFESSHPRWSYARLNNKGEVLETAEKKVISNHATSGIYYFKSGKMFVEAALSMLEKDIRFNGDFYVCPVFNELILKDQRVGVWPIKRTQMHSLGTPEDLRQYLNKEVN